MSQVTVSLPDGSELSVPSGSSAEDVAYAIGEGLGDACIGAYINGDFTGKETTVTDGDTINIITEDSDEALRVIRHSAAHVFAQALQREYPEAKLAIGPPTDDGFYYDIAGVELAEDDLDVIEDEMSRIIDADYPIERAEWSRQEALEYYNDNPYKQDILQDEAAGEENVSVYKQDDFVDLCRGPHVDSTGEIGAVALLQVSGSYWRGDEENDTLVRVHGTAFRDEDALEEFLEQRRKAEERDHRRLGRMLDLFSVSDHSPAIQFRPKGMRIRRALEEYIREKNEELGYEEVWTPELNEATLWEQSGHYEAFAEDGEMFAWEQDDSEFGLKPMNCANHAQLYEEEVRSYRDLPIRFSEFGTVYRNERSGATSGLFRVRGFTQDDGHAFVRRDQLRDEVERTLAVLEDVYDAFGLERTYKLETKPDNALGDDALWDEATAALQDALEAHDLDYSIEDGEGAFYGPKIGADIEDVFGRQWTLGTVQLDFNIPRRFDLSYTGEDNEQHQPVMVHRALLGAFERFMGIIIEHTNAKFPTWLAPEQVRVIPISDSNADYAQDVAGQLESIAHVEVDDSDRTVDRRIRAAHEERVPYIVIVGDDEEEDGSIALRDRMEREVRGVEVSSFRDDLSNEIKQREREVSVLDAYL